MPGYAFNTPKFDDVVDAVNHRLNKVKAKGQKINREQNPNGQYELFTWCVEEIEQLRAKLRQHVSASDVPSQHEDH